MRAEGWEHVLAGHIQEAYGLPFRWGTHDCALWSARWVRACTGNDFLSDWEGKYTTELGARRLMKKRGFDSVEEIADAHLVETPVRLAKRGDLLLHREGVLGVCFGRHGYFLGAHDVRTENTLSCVKAWAV